MDTKYFGRKISALRKKKGLTQAQLAEKINVSNKTISRWETGEGYPEISLLKPLAIALGTSVDELLSEEEETESQSDSSREKNKEPNRNSEEKRVNLKCEEVPIDIDALKKRRFKRFWESLIIFNKIALVCLITCVYMFLVHIIANIIGTGQSWIITIGISAGVVWNIALLSCVIGLILGFVGCCKKQTKGCVVFGVISFVGRIVFPWLAVMVNLLI